VVTFEDLWTAQVRAQAAGDTGAADRALRDIRRLRVERNVASHDTVGLGLVLQGVSKLDRRERDAAEEAFRNAVVIAPGLPDAHFGLAYALLRKGPLGLVPSVSVTLGGLAAFLRSGRGAVSVRSMATTAWLLFGFAVCWTVAIGLLVRHGGLLRHDIEEWLGPAQNPSATLGLFLAVLLVPVATFQGWGWLPLWWLAVLLTYFNRKEKAVAVLLALGVVGVGPVVARLETALRTAGNPLYGAALSAVEGCPDRAVIERLDQAQSRDPQDRDLTYLLGAARKRLGGYEDAAELYRRLLAVDPGDSYARNNLANIEFARGSYDSARARYTQGTAGRDSAEVTATSYYNLSLAHLQKFDYQAFDEAKSNADRVAPGLIAGYERWKYDTGDYAVVDLGLTREQVWTKFAGAADGVAVANVVRGAAPQPHPDRGVASLLNRFSASIGVFCLAAFAVWRWRGGQKAFTLHCAKCGTAFCRYCHLGQAGGGLCSQCYHLFVVRDGVSGPARNRKLSEVQDEDARRDRVFRVLSVLAPGAGHLYAGKTLLGVTFVACWYGVIAVVLASWIVPLTEVPGRLVPLWPWIAAAVLLVVVWLGANRGRPATEILLPTRRSGPRRANVAQGT
jgi:Tfp pilus assembly protein PilF